MLLRAGGIHSKNNGVLLLGQGPAIPKLAKLFGANRGFIGRVENQNNIFAVKPGERNSISVLIGKGKVRRQVAYFERFRE